ncbi:MAG: VanZ family protein [Flavobacterium sp.]|nr:VanZ family protein [Flavobacterium sp.]
MPKEKLWLAAAAGWSLIVAVLCLVQLTNMPDVGVSSPDKYVHSAFHFFFTIFWFLYFDAKSTRSKTLNLLLVFVFSVLFGTIIELAQMYFTVSRTAEIDDILANTLGSVLGVGVLVIYSGFRKNRN